MNMGFVDLMLAVIDIVNIKYDDSIITLSCRVRVLIRLMPCVRGRHSMRLGVVCIPTYLLKLEKKNINMSM